MRENRLYGSEGGADRTLSAVPTPVRRKCFRPWPKNIPFTDRAASTRLVLEK